MKLGGERRETFHPSETSQRHFQRVGIRVKRALRGRVSSPEIPCARAPPPAPLAIKPAPAPHLPARPPQSSRHRARARTPSSCPLGLRRRRPHSLAPPPPIFPRPTPSEALPRFTGQSQPAAMDPPPVESSGRRASGRGGRGRGASRLGMKTARSAAPSPSPASSPAPPPVSAPAAPTAAPAMPIPVPAAPTSAHAVPTTSTVPPQPPQGGEWGGHTPKFYISSWKSRRPKFMVSN
jgi:hypothetical protein